MLGNRFEYAMVQLVGWPAPLENQHKHYFSELKCVWFAEYIVICNSLLFHNSVTVFYMRGLFVKTVFILVCSSCFELSSELQVFVSDVLYMFCTCFKCTPCVRPAHYHNLSFGFDVTLWNEWRLWKWSYVKNKIFHCILWLKAFPFFSEFHLDLAN